MSEPSAAPAYQERVGLGLASVIVAIFCFSLMDAVAKWLGHDYAAIQIAFFRNLFGLIPVAIITWQAGGWRNLRTHRIGAQVLRAALLWIALLTFFIAIRTLALAEAVAIAFAAPLFVTALSVPMLGEHVGLRRWSACVVGFLGVLVMLRPGAGAFQPEAVLVLISALGYALAMLLTRRIVRTETTAALVFYGTLVGLLANACLLPFFWSPPAAGDLPLFVALGLLGGTGAFLMVQAYRHAQAAVVAPFDYTALIWAALFGWIVWREVPDGPVWLGAAIVVASGLYIIHREARLGTRPNAPPPVAGPRPLD